MSAPKTLVLVCAWCGRSFEWTPPHPGAARKRYCKRTHKDRANQASRAFASHFRPGVCPTSDKRAFDSEESARHFLHRNPHLIGCRIYLCNCGMWHIGRVRQGITPKERGEA